MKFKYMKSGDCCVIHATDDEGKVLLDGLITDESKQGEAMEHGLEVRHDGVLQCAATVYGGFNKSLRAMKGLMSGLMSHIGHHGRLRANAAKKAADGAAAAERAGDFGSGEPDSHKQNKENAGENPTVLLMTETEGRVSGGDRAGICNDRAASDAAQDKEVAE